MGHPAEQNDHCLFHGMTISSAAILHWHHLECAFFAAA